MNGTPSSATDVNAASYLTLRSKIVWSLLVVACLLVVPGCGGCFKQETAAQKKAREKKEAKEREKKKKKKPKKDFEYSRMQTQPGDTVRKRNAVKQGHYLTCRQQITANNFDYRAIVTSAAIDSSLRAIPVPNTPYAIEYARDVPLPKGQPKWVRTMYFIPRKTSTTSKRISLRSEMRSKHGGSGIPGVQEATTRMPAHQYFFVVLAKDNGAYTYLKRIDSVEPPVDEYTGEDNKIIYYRVINPKVDDLVPLPAHPFAWTSISYLLWDDIDPSAFTPAQQDAMKDWLHWGGQLIVSGPNSIDTLRGSFLNDYLPVTVAQADELTQEDFATLNENFSKSFRRQGKEISTDLSILPSKPMLGSSFKLTAGSRFVEKTGEMVAERRVGRGRVVVTRFPLSEKRIIRWKSFDNVLNNVILRRPPRRFKAGHKMGDFKVPEFELAGYTGHGKKKLRIDPRLSSTMRYFSRDVGPIARYAVNRTTPDPVTSTEAVADLVASHDHDVTRDDTANIADWRGDGYVASGISGVAGWNDSSGVASAARELLVDAAGIKIPDSTFVLKVLMGYLLVLVPVNWLVFRLLGRVEWAWVAAPIIALGGAGVVIRLAELDIGFARSHNEIATLEIHSGYERGHLTRYAALYTSLATSYSVVFPDTTAVVQPFSTRNEKFNRRSLILLRFFVGNHAELSGFQIKGNDTRNLHAEQMIQLGGTFDLVGDDETTLQLKNDTSLALQDAGVMRRTKQGDLQLCWLGELKPHTSRTLSFKDRDAAWFTQWDDNDVTFSHDREVDRFMATHDEDGDSFILKDELPPEHPLHQSFALYDGSLESSGESLDQRLSREEVMEWCRQERSGAVSLGKLFDVATMKLRLRPGQVRLIGWTDKDPDPQGMRVYPVASQKDLRALVLVHLQQAVLAPVKSDINSKYQFVDESFEEGTALFGAYVEDITPDLQSIYNLTRPDGVVIVDVTNGGAAQLGRLRVGDVLVTVDGRAVKNAVEFRTIVRDLPRDKQIEIVYIRGGEKEATDIQLQSLSLFR